MPLLLILYTSPWSSDWKGVLLAEELLAYNPSPHSSTLADYVSVRPLCLKRTSGWWTGDATKRLGLVGKCDHATFLLLIFLFFVWL